MNLDTLDLNHFACLGERCNNFLDMPKEHWIYYFEGEGVPVHCENCEGHTVLKEGRRIYYYDFQIDAMTT